MRRVSASQSILQALQGGVQFASSSFGMLHLLEVEVLYLLNPSLVILPFLYLVCALESLNLCNRLVSVFIDFVDLLDHAGQVSAFDSQFFLQFQIHLLKDESLTPELVNLVAKWNILVDGFTVPLVGLV